MGLGPYHRVYTSCFRCWYGSYSETQRELKEVLNDGVNPRDVKAEILPSGGDKNTIQSPSTLFHKLMSSQIMTTHTKK